MGVDGAFIVHHFILVKLVEVNASGVILSVVLDVVSISTLPM